MINIMTCFRNNNFRHLRKQFSETFTTSRFLYDYSTSSALFNIRVSGPLTVEVYSIIRFFLNRS